MKAIFSIVGVLLVGTVAWSDPSDLGKAQMAAAKKAYELNLLTIQKGVGDAKVGSLNFEKTSFWSKHWLKAELVLREKKSDRVKAYEDHLDRMRELQGMVRKLVEVEFSFAAEAAAVEYYRLEAEIMLHKAKGK